MGSKGRPHLPSQADAIIEGFVAFLRDWFPHKGLSASRSVSTSKNHFKSKLQASESTFHPDSVVANDVHDLPECEGGRVGVLYPFVYAVCNV